MRLVIISAKLLLLVGVIIISALESSTVDRLSCNLTVSALITSCCNSPVQILALTVRTRIRLVNEDLVCKIPVEVA